MCRKVFAIRSADYLCRSTQTICRTRQISDLKRNSHADGADICRALWRAKPRR